MAASPDDAFGADRALEPYWQAAGEGRLLLGQCEDCGAAYYYPRPTCPFCMSARTTWLEAGGEGAIYSFSIERRADPPYVIAFVTLAEGPTLLTEIVEAPFETLAIGQRVQLAFETRDEQPVPVFRPVD